MVDLYFTESVSRADGMLTPKGFLSNRPTLTWPGAPISTILSLWLCVWMSMERKYFKNAEIQLLSILPPLSLWYFVGT